MIADEPGAAGHQKRMVLDFREVIRHELYLFLVSLGKNFPDFGWPPAPAGATGVLEEHLRNVSASKRILPEAQVSWPRQAVIVRLRDR